MELSYERRPRRRVGTVSLSVALGHLSPPVRAAALEAAAQLEWLGIRYAFAGGIAVGAHGYVRETFGVDFLVGDDAFEQHGALITFKQGVPIQIGQVRIDYLSTAALGPAVRGLDSPVRSDGLPVVPVEVLVYLKLVAHRRKDQADVVELLESGVDARTVRAWLEEHAPDLVARFDLLAEDAERERG
jgi:hypothetical protein